jgi:hypothetical protein
LEPFCGEMRRLNLSLPPVSRVSDSIQPPFAPCAFAA